MEVSDKCNKIKSISEIKSVSKTKNFKELNKNELRDLIKVEILKLNTLNKI